MHACAWLRGPSAQPKETRPVPVCKVTHRDLAIVDCLLWSCRDPVTGAIVVSYTALCRLANVSREAVAGAVL